MRSNYLKSSILGLVYASVALTAAAALAQTSIRAVPGGLPEAPQPAVALESTSFLAEVGEAQQEASRTATAEPRPTSAPSDRAPQTKRILGIIPNFRSVSTDEKLPPQSAKDKFTEATHDSFDYSSVFIPAMLAAYSLGTDADPEFGTGATGYGRYFWHAAVDQTSENYMVEFIVPVITREDTRFYTLGRGGFFKRTGYALSRTFVTRTDSGSETFNFSEVIGSGASSGISSLYYPSRERNFSNTATEWGIDIGIDAASFVAKEFWPDVNRRLFHASNATTAPQR